MDRNKINVEIFGIKTIGLVDTGAAISCVSDSQINKLNQKDLKISNTSTIHIYGVGGEEHMILGKVTLPLRFNRLIIKYPFYVVQQLQYPLILGDDFLSQNKCNIHYPTRTLYLHEGSWQVALLSAKNGRARVAKRCKIPANSIAEIPVKIPENIGNDSVLLEPLDYLTNCNLIEATCLVSAKIMFL